VRACHARTPRLQRLKRLQREVEQQQTHGDAFCTEYRCRLPTSADSEDKSESTTVQGTREASHASKA
jgi:hypothetical protein